MTYKALGRSIANYAAPVWSKNASESNIGKIQRAQNEALRIITGSHKMSSIDHIHSETKMLQVEDHLNLLLRNIWYNAWIQRMFVTTSPRWIFHQGKNEGDNLHQTLSNRVTTASKQQERHISGTSHLICQYRNMQHEG